MCFAYSRIKHVYEESWQEFLPRYLLDQKGRPRLTVNGSKKSSRSQVSSTERTELSVKRRNGNAWQRVTWWPSTREVRVQGIRQQKDERGERLTERAPRNFVSRHTPLCNKCRVVVTACFLTLMNFPGNLCPPLSAESPEPDISWGLTIACKYDSIYHEPTMRHLTATRDWIELRFPTIFKSQRL